MTTALFAGSFDPFTLGHLSIVNRILTFVDEVIIGVGVNINKHYCFPTEERIQRIQAIFAHNSHVKVMSYEGLTTDFAKTVGATILVRGVRSCKDFEEEREIATINRQLSGLETILLFAEDKYTNVSSSIVKELMHYGKDISEFIP
ncbi:MAG: pantetheine-phosphate adenylyltransferase [Prevotellaceae bacterium]|nr:pantetheine-phosphate adenylyltransferase [Candidatus Colivivens equi]MCQ2075410.1 pantetheine-phosphate adenylyltransferase [Bacteroidaceae bacterium]